MQTIAIAQQQADFFKAGNTLPYSFRIAQLKALHTCIQKYEAAILQALHTDLGKSAEEAYASEVGFTLAELSTTIQQLKNWMKPTRVATNLLNLPGSSKTYPHPLGVVLIIAPWNYPFQLAFAPLIGAIAGGNCAVVKPSELAPATAQIVETIIQELYPPQFVAAIQGIGQEVLPPLITGFAFNHIFFTGSTQVGKSIYQLAAQHLTPVTLELGGKSPAIIEPDANLALAARKIAFGKWLNAGQTCVAPDYVLVPSTLQDELVAQLQQAAQQFFGKEALQNKAYPRIISPQRFKILEGYLTQGTVAWGGKTNEATLQIEPTVLLNPSWDSAIMQQEIFGPILPIITYSTQEQAYEMVQKNPNPLSLYLFTNSSATEQWWLQHASFGGGCINNTLLHLSNHHLPFGGVGSSGVGAYHGKHSFITFTHQKAVLKTPTWFDPSFKYPPFTGKMKLYKLFMK
ncbi:MAG: aldehyde dehydrogenase family protein [Bacteroidetes bacterium]|nr:MAG: aldehyde dehydrogenase family protein [Bacteroidota bacterium]TAE68822.1 MAG: aldehyde dehydrogenase family protein [Bacteroidota bacterium]TAF91847.1 MAG: aldehyde dehydrogenase family protein [Bacteroidota bacterium]